MHTSNTLYKDPSHLEQWINKLKLDTGEHCLVRIHSSISDTQICLDIAVLIKKLLPNCSINGACVSSIVYNGTIYDDEILISINKFERGTFKTIIKSVENLSFNQIASSIVENTNNFNTGLAILFFGYEETNISQIVDILDSEIKDTSFVGGIAATMHNGEDMQAYVFDENGVYQNSYILSMISRDYILSYTNIVTGQSVVSKDFTITSSFDEYVDTIDNQPTIKWLNENLGLNKFQTIKDFDVAVTEDILLRFPLVLKDKNNSTRFLAYEEENNRIKLHSNKLLAGDKFNIGYLSPLRSAEQWQDICLDLQTTCAESIFFYSCILRRLFSNNIAKWEMEPFKHLNICGAFIPGEIGTKDNQIQYLNGACSLFTLAEKESYLKPNLKAFNSIDKLIVKNDNLSEKINLVAKSLKSDNDISVLDTLVQYENHIKNRLSTGSNHNFKSTTQFLQEQSTSPKKQICFISIENSAKHLDYLGQSNFNKLIKENISNISNFLKNTYTDYTFTLYNYDHSSFYFTINQDIKDDEFTDIIKNIYVHCGSDNFLNNSVACINNFTFTLKGKAVHKLSEFANSNSTADMQKRFNLCDYEQDNTNNLQNEFQMVATLNTIIKENLVSPYFQGIYDNRNNCFFCYEALMRLQTPDGKMLFPGDFMEISKKYHLYLPLSLCMVKKVLEIFANRTEVITLNISAYDIVSQDFQNTVFELLDSMENPAHFIFEIVETERFNDIKQLKYFMHKAKKYGIKFAADDFGSGYANFIEIGNLEFDYIKINGSLTQLLGTDASYNEILDSIAYMGKRMKVELIAEFVETASMQKQLVNSGVHYSQGYFFSKPMPLEELNTVSAENQIKISENIKNQTDSKKQAYINPKNTKRKNNILFLGGIMVGILTIISLIIFAGYNHSEIKKISDTFLIEIATGLADKVSLFAEDSGLSLQLSTVAVEDNYDNEEALLPILTDIANTSKFEDVYISLGGLPAFNGSGDELQVDITTIYDKPIHDNVYIYSPITEEHSGRDILLMGLNIFENGEKVGELYGKYYLDDLSELLDLKSFGGEAFYHLCEIDGTPLYLSGSNNNLFQGGDMYDFIGSLDIYNGHTTQSIKEDMYAGNTVLLNYLINGEERSAVMSTIPGTDWCVVSIVLSEVTSNMIDSINNGTYLFVSFIIIIYAVYFVINIILASANKKQLVKALESSYFLTNSLQRSIETDSLTRTFSRATATEKISDVIASSQDNNSIHALVILDIDNFKEINDTYGHQTGDLYLQDFVSAVKAGLRAGDILGRLGGDEFILLLNNIKNQEVAEKILDRILQNVNGISMTNTSLDNVSLSAGVCMIPKYGVDYETLNNLADKALYVAKKSGKNKFVIYDDNM